MYHGQASLNQRHCACLCDPPPPSNPSCCLFQVSIDVNGVLKVTHLVPLAAQPGRAAPTASSWAATPAMSAFGNTQQVSKFKRHLLPGMCFGQQLVLLQVCLTVCVCGGGVHLSGNVCDSALLMVLACAGYSMRSLILSHACIDCISGIN